MVTGTSFFDLNTRDDGIVVTSDPDPLAVAWSIKYGESVPNTQMAAVVLRDAAGVFLVSVFTLKR